MSTGLLSGACRIQTETERGERARETERSHFRNVLEEKDIGAALLAAEHSVDPLHPYLLRLAPQLNYFQSNLIAMTTHKLTYFNIQGAAEKVRLAFVLAGVAFEDVRITGEEWATLKPTTKFGQLPMLNIDGVEFAQSGAMVRYVARLGDGSLAPTDPIAELKLNEIIGLSEDMDRAFGPCLYFAIRPTMFGLDAEYNKTPEGQEHIRKLRVKFVEEQLPVFMEQYTRFLASTGGAITYVQLLYYILTYICDFFYS